MAPLDTLVELVEISKEHSLSQLEKGVHPSHEAYYKERINELEQARLWALEQAGKLGQ